MKDIKRILLVCTGNSCRSIMAEAYLKSRFAEENIDIEVKSAGTWGRDGEPASREALKAIKEEGIDPKGYESNALTKELIDWADAILVMEHMHKEWIVRMVSAAEEKVYFLKEFGEDDDELSIPDPVGRTIAFYRASFGIIKNSIEEFMEWLKK